MAANTTETLLLSVQVDIVATLKRLEELQALLQKNVGAVVALNKRFSEGKLALGEYATGQAQLLQQTKQITQEQTILTKAVEGQEKASRAARQTQAAATGSIDALQAKLKDATKAYNALGEEERKTGQEGARLALEQQRQTALVAKATEERKEQAAADRQAAKDLAQLDKINQLATGSLAQLRLQLSQLKGEYALLSAEERDNTEAGQKLQAQTKAINDQVSVLEQSVGVFSRNVGNYAGAIEPLIAQLVKLEEQQKLIPEGGHAYADNIVKIKGFQQAVNDAGIKMGLTYEQTQDKLNGVTEAVRPAVAALVKLEAEQEKVEKGTEAYTQIGFKIGKATKAIEHTTDELKKAAPETKKFSTGLLDAARNSDLFGGAVDKATGIQQKLVQAQELAKLATGGWTGALGLLRVALIATGLGALVVVLGSVVTYLTQTAEGSRLLTTVMDQVGAVVNVVVDRFGQFGKAVTQILSGDFKGAAATAKGAMAGFGDEIKREVKLSGDLSKARQQLDIDTAKNIATNKRLLNEVERLKNVRDNEFNTIQQRQKANEDAYKIELTREKTLADLASRRIALIQGEINLRGGLSKASLEQRKQLGEAENELSDIQEDAAGKQNELITNRFTLNKEKLEQEQKLREDAIKRTIAGIQRELLAVKEGSDRELELKQNLIAQQARLEAAAADKTAADRQLILGKQLADTLKLDEEFAKTRQDRAAKQLETEINQGIVARNAEKKRKDDAQKDVDDGYRQQEGTLERHLTRMRAAIEDNYAQGRIDQKQYEASISFQEEADYAARIVLARQFGKDTSKLEEQRDKAHRSILVKQRQEEAKVYADRVALAESFGQEVGALFAQTITETGQTLQEFAGKVLILILSQLEKTILAASVEATAKSIASNPTPGGIIQAAVTSGLIIAAFEAVKGVISTTTAEPFNTGGIVGGSLSPNSPNQDTELTYLTKGEVVINRASSQMFPEVLSYLNSLGGGANFSPGFAPVKAQPADGGLVARSIGGGAVIDYERLAQACAKVPVFANPTLLNNAAAAQAARVARVSAR